MNHHLILIGPRGSGKTTVARLLASHLSIPWRDADAILCERTGKTIRAIFQEEGEAAFRQYESAILADLCRDAPAVIATGGGVVTVAANRELLKMSGRVVWLTAEPETLWQRIQKDAATTAQRPALTALTGLEELRAVLAAREPWYRECAEFTIDTTGQTPEDVTQRILSLPGLFPLIT
jgi:shikimate kinase